MSCFNARSSGSARFYFDEQASSRSPTEASGNFSIHFWLSSWAGFKSVFRYHSRLQALCQFLTVAVVSICTTGLCQTKLRSVRPLESHTTDFAAEMVSGIDQFLLKELQDSPILRAKYWENQSSAADARLETRQWLEQALGMREARLDSNQGLSSIVRSSFPASPDKNFSLHRISWRVLPDPVPGREQLCSVHGEGLLLEPKRAVLGNIILLASLQHSLEQSTGISGSEHPLETSLAWSFAKQGYRVFIPHLIPRVPVSGRHRNTLHQREFLQRSAYELGKHILGYELHKVMALVDRLAHQQEEVTVLGVADGGVLSMLAGALDERIASTGVIGHFGPRAELWREPWDRNIFGLLQRLDDSDLSRLIAPRSLVVGTFGYTSELWDGQGGQAPAEIHPPDSSALQQELASARDHFPKDSFAVCPSLAAFLQAYDVSPVSEPGLPNEKGSAIESKLNIEHSLRSMRQFQELDRHNQLLLSEASFARAEFFADLDTSSLDTFRESIEKYRDIFRREIIGEFDQELRPVQARARQKWEREKWTGHEVVVDVFDQVIAYGVLLLPTDLKAGERRPVIVCQHGLEGRPTDTFLGDHPAYHDFAARLCEQGFIVFAPQNPYIFGDRFRTLQRKANPLGKTLFSIMVPQHRQLIQWLKKQDFVDPERIAFYGLSYGGKSAMRIPALVDDYCLSICSADFNEWVLKNASSRHPFSYLWTGEYEIFEWNLGNTFNYYEMAALICPRPFMVERGHFDRVASDEWVAYEYAKVRNLYAAQLKIPERTKIEWFRGPHTINGQGTFDFLKKHLGNPRLGQSE